MQYNHALVVQRIKELMGEKGLSMAGLSTAAKLGNTTVRDLMSEDYKGNPRFRTLSNIAEALEVDFGYLLGLTNDRSK